MDLLALDSRRGAKTSACVPAPSARSGQHARVNVCVRARALRAQRALATGPFARQRQLLPLRSPTAVDRGGRELDYLDPPYSRPIASFASDRDSLPYCPVIGQSPSTPLLPIFYPNLSLLASLIYPGPDISNTAGLPLLMRFSGSAPPTRMVINISCRGGMRVTRCAKLEI